MTQRLTMVSSKKSFFAVSRLTEQILDKVSINFINTYKWYFVKKKKLMIDFCFMTNIFKPYAHHKSVDCVRLHLIK